MASTTTIQVELSWTSEHKWIEIDEQTGKQASNNYKNEDAKAKGEQEREGEEENPYCALRHMWIEQSGILLFIVPDPSWVELNWIEVNWTEPLLLLSLLILHTLLIIIYLYYSSLNTGTDTAAVIVHVVTITAC